MTKTLLAPLCLPLLLSLACSSESTRDPQTSDATAYESIAGDTPESPEAAHTLAVLNQYRAEAGAPPLVYAQALSQFALASTQDFANGGAPHAYFARAAANGSLWQGGSGFCSGAAENQAPSWSVYGEKNAVIDSMLKVMMDEGPGGGHHDNIINPRYHRVGVGLVEKGGKLYLTNDFSGVCQ